MFSAIYTPMPEAGKSDKWFFDKSVWQRLFRMLNECKINTLIISSNQLLDIIKNEDIDDHSQEYLDMFSWIFENSLDYNIAPYSEFSFNGDPSKQNIDDTKQSIKKFINLYNEFTGIIVDVTGMSSGRADFIQSAIISPIDAIRPEMDIILNHLPNEFKGLTRKADRNISYLKSYTGNRFVDANPDNAYKSCQEEMGAGNVIADIKLDNYQPFTSFSYDISVEIRQRLAGDRARGFVVHPLSLHHWPYSPDKTFKFQWQRDMVWYYIWGGADIPQLQRLGTPKWLKRNTNVMPGFQASSRIVEILSLYFTGIHPVYSSGIIENIPYLFTLTDILEMPKSDGEWVKEITGERAIFISEYVKTGTPDDEFGPEELIDELNDLSEQALSAGDKGLRSASGEIELPAYAQQALSFGFLAKYYVQRVSSALAYTRGNAQESLEMMKKAIEYYKQVIDLEKNFVDDKNQNVFMLNLSNVLIALEKEYEDAAAGIFKPGKEYIVK